MIGGRNIKSININKLSPDVFNLGVMNSKKDTQRAAIMAYAELWLKLGERTGAS